MNRQKQWMLVAATALLAPGIGMLWNGTTHDVAHAQAPPTPGKPGGPGGPGGAGRRGGPGRPGGPGQPRQGTPVNNGGPGGPGGPGGRRGGGDPFAKPGAPGPGGATPTAAQVHITHKPGLDPFNVPWKVKPPPPYVFEAIEPVRVASEEVEPPIVNPVTVREEPALRVSGIMTGDGVFAILEQQGQVDIVKPGSSVDISGGQTKRTYKVVSIKGDVVTLESKEGNVTFQQVVPLSDAPIGTEVPGFGPRGGGPGGPMSGGPGVGPGVGVPGVGPGVGPRRGRPNGGSGGTGRATSD